MSPGLGAQQELRGCAQGSRGGETKGCRRALRISIGTTGSPAFIWGVSPRAVGAAALPFPHLQPPCPAASGDASKIRRWWLQRADDEGFGSAKRTLAGAQRPVTCARRPDPPRFTVLGWEPGLRPAFCWHRALLGRALGTSSTPAFPWGVERPGKRLAAAGTGRATCKLGIAC